MDKMFVSCLSEIKGIDEQEKTLTAYISTKSRDRMDESLVPDGADLRKFNKNPVVLFGHDYSQPPIGKALWTKKDSKGIISKMKFADTAFANDIFKLYKDGYMNAFSVGFLPTEWEDGDGQKTASRTYTKWELLEYSAVPVPANPEALTLALQKGIITDTTKDILDQVAINEPDPDEEQDEQVQEQPEQKEFTDVGVSELMTEIGLLKESINALNGVIEDQEKEMSELRYKLFTAIKSNTPKTLSEMTDDEIVRHMNDVVVGVIRKAQGKVN